MYSNIIATLVHVLLAIQLAVKMEMGMTGIAIATSIHFVVRFIVTIGYIYLCGKFNDPEIQVPFTDPECFKNWKGQFI